MIDDIQLGILAWLNQTDNDTSVVTFEVITAGSTLLSGTAEPTQTTASVGSSNMQSGISSTNTIPGTAFTITGSSITTNGVSSSSESSESSSVGMIVGVVIGAIVLVALAVIIVVLYKRKKASAEAVGPLNTTENGVAIENNMSNNTIEDWGMTIEKQNDIMQPI